MPANALASEAFKRIYPEHFFKKFIEELVRPDGRPLAGTRPASVALGVVSTADSSALVKFGKATVLVGIKSEVMQTVDEAPEEGNIAVQVEMTPFCSASSRPGRPSETAQVLTEQMTSVLQASQLVNLKQLCIDRGKAAWMLYIDVYVLDDDGSLHDVCLLAIVAALSSVRLRKAIVDDSGNVVLQQNEGVINKSQLQISTWPTSLTCGLYKDNLLIDLTAEEEQLVDATILTTVTSSGEVVGVSKTGGAHLSWPCMQDCIEAAQMRHEELKQLLNKTLNSTKTSSK